MGTCGQTQETVENLSSASLPVLGGGSSMLGCVGGGLVSPGAALNVGPGLEKAENEEDMRGNLWTFSKPGFKF